ncbi:hypothetical protein E4U21_001921 [Claviceps maximensis]|nr:hypothetical protein E4U21_001921 [Claviceps maximensis]
MAVRTLYEATCDQDFRTNHKDAFECWINTPGNASLETDSGPIYFDQANVLSSLHPNTSRYDRNPEPHATIRLSDASLRGEDS